MVFNKQPSAGALKDYLEDRPGFDEIDLMLFSHGVNSIGLVSIDEWRRIIAAGAKRNSFIGVDEDAYPRDFAIFVRYHEDLVRKIKSRYPMPAPLSLETLDEFLNQSSGRYQVQWD
jgi:hypothetical protein